MHLSWMKWAQKRIDRGLPPDDSVVQSSSAKASRSGDPRKAVVRQELELLYMLAFRSAVSQIEKEGLSDGHSQVAAETGLNRNNLYRLSNPAYSTVFRIQFRLRFATPKYSVVVRECVPAMLRSYRNRGGDGEPLDRPPSRSEIIAASLMTTRPHDEFRENCLQSNASSQVPSPWRKMFECWQSAIQPRPAEWDHFREAGRQWCEPLAILRIVVEDLWQSIGQDVEELIDESRRA